MFLRLIQMVSFSFSLLVKARLQQCFQEPELSNHWRPLVSSTAMQSHKICIYFLTYYWITNTVCSIFITLHSIEDSLPWTHLFDVLLRTALVHLVLSTHLNLTYPRPKNTNKICHGPYCSTEYCDSLVLFKSWDFITFSFFYLWIKMLWPHNGHDQRNKATRHSMNIHSGHYDSIHIIWEPYLKQFRPNIIK
jgi:hypothetical protein